MKILELVFTNFWTFVGSFILLSLSIKGIIHLIHGHPPKNYSEAEIVAIYKLGKIDHKNNHILNDEDIISEIEALLKNKKHGSKN